MVFKLFQRTSPKKPTERASQEDYELLHTLCTVWPHGPYTQKYLDNQDHNIAPLVAQEIISAIQESIYADLEIGQDHIELLQRIESDQPGKIAT
jgi:hypothetical protein